METRDLVGLLEIAFEDSLSLKERRHLIYGGEKTKDIFERLNRIPKTKEAEDCALWLEKGYGNALWYGDPAFPDFNPIERKLPYVLFYKGRKPLKNPSITIVGTRFATEPALQSAFCLGFEAQLNGISVVTGLAHGIDQAAARGSLSVSNLGLTTNMIAVLGCGLEVDYPVMSNVLKERIIDNGGTIISQFPPTEPGLKQNFPNRNLTMAAFGDACIVVQAPEKSGALITADFSLQMGKEVYVSKAGTLDCSKNRGTIELKEEGANEISSIGQYYRTKYSILKTDKPVRPFARYGEYNYTVIKTNKMI